ncbi:phage holin family protein [Formosa sp. A9]|uniref:phage holin family protein n=1 Tax=Formosa sp. A9 TaxID=3442641 RepID=UPI003EBA377F
MRELILELAEKFGLFALGGLIGAIIHRFRNKMTLKKFISTLVVSSFMGLSVGILLNNYLQAPEEVVFVACALAGVFSNDILNEFQTIISYASDWVKIRLRVNKTEDEA